jgi:myo-inositol-1(or 4)-monophosphatase
MGYDPVTVADHAAESVIRDAIKAAYPTHGIHGEEHGREAGRRP